MSNQGEGTGSFRIAIRHELRPAFDALPKAIQSTVRSMLIRAATDPGAARVVFAEGEAKISGTVQDAGQLYYISLRFTYDPEKHVIILATMSKPLLIPGMH